MKITKEKLEGMSPKEFAEVRKKVLWDAGHELLAVQHMERGFDRAMAAAEVQGAGGQFQLVMSETWRRLLADKNKEVQGELASAHEPGFGSGVEITSPELTAADDALHDESRSWSGPLLAAQSKIAMLNLAIVERQESADNGMPVRVRDLVKKIEDAEVALDEMNQDRKEAIAPLETTYTEAKRAAASEKMDELGMLYRNGLEELKAVCVVLAATRLSQFEAYANYASAASTAGRDAVDIRPSELLDRIISAWNSPAKMMAEAERLRGRRLT